MFWTEGKTQVSISTTVTVGAGKYVPFFPEKRGGQDGKSPVGTLFQRATDVGEAGGGLASLILTHTQGAMGFRDILIPIYVSVLDNLAAVSGVGLIWNGAGNERLSSDTFQVIQTVANSNAQNSGKAETSGILVECRSLAAAAISTVEYANVDGKVYIVSWLFMVYDRELIEKQGSIADLVSGVR